MKYKCLSIVSPNGTRIARGEKTLEVRSWKPDLQFGEEILIIENQTFLRKEGEVEHGAKPVALVRVGKVRKWEEADVAAACASYWAPDYYACELYDVRPISTETTALAARGIYEQELSL